MSDLFNFANYGQERERIATETELEIFEIIKSVTGRDDLQLVRKSPDYVTALLGDWDLARFKYTTRAKWIVLPVIEAGSKKHRFNSPGDVAAFADQLKASVEHILNHA